MLNYEDALDLMLTMRKTIPEEGMWVEACQELAELITTAQTRLSEIELAMLVGIGALMARQGQREFEAGLHTDNFFNRLRKE